MINKRTDMAVEEVSSGYKYEIDRIIQGMNLKKCVLSKSEAKKFNKNPGIYYNLDNIDYYNKDTAIIKIVSSVLKDIINTMSNIKNVLIIGLGNPMITPDSLGPLVINKVEVNRHLNGDYKFITSAMSPGVMGQTGMESSEIIKAVVDDFNPDLVLVIDALACSDLSRMCHSIQISTAGINPGSGVGNHRKEISKDVLGIEVIAIGVPTVSDINTIVDMENDYYITPNNIDAAMDIISSIISRAINKALIEGI